MADDAYDIGDGPEDVAGAAEEEDFESGMRRNAQDYEAADVDQDNAQRKSLNSSASFAHNSTDFLLAVRPEASRSTTHNPNP